MMKIFFPFCCFLFIIGCNDRDAESTPASENDVDAARNFIRAALDGDYKKANVYMLQDSINNQLLGSFEDNYKKNMDPMDKRSYREASIRIPDVRKVSDSISVISYSNSYKNEVDSLRVVKTGGTWLVDLKYSFLMKDSVP